MTLSKCHDCNHLCCNYITVKIPAPRTILDFDGLLWQLAHENIKALRDHTGWHLVIYNKCMHLKSNGECNIYENRPITCREHSIESCEYSGSILESAMQCFQSYEELDEYCSKRFKTWKKRS
jgi:Fe-S-cluster containining protein